jgi:glycosyltransferase involved in cell wall biosynthesis
MTKAAGVKLVVLHSHYRPGGVRRVIELALPALAASRALGVREIVLVGGEAPDPVWRAELTGSLPEIRISFSTSACVGYRAELRRTPAAVTRALRRTLADLLGPPEGKADTVVWAHNLGLGRNLLLARELVRACTRRNVRLLSHHHDWWFDNRWQRWPEIRASGFRTLRSVEAVVFSRAVGVRHATINRADHRILSGALGVRAGWLPNLVIRTAAPAAVAVDAARKWCERQMGEAAPVWLAPCRLLRRKHLAEAWLLTRWLRPEAWLLTTGGVSSADEQPYAQALQAAAKRHGWRLRLGVLAGGDQTKPGIPALLAASEALLLTSLQEGFGLPFLEASAARRPLIARRLPQVAPDLASFGFRFPQSYDELWIAPELFDHRAEQQRQAQRWSTWRAALPRACQALATRPPWLDDPLSPRAFSRLTLVAQLEVLAHDTAVSWELCAPLNPWLRSARARAARGALSVSPWPRTADQQLGPAAYASRLARLLRQPAPADAASSPPSAGRAFLRARLGGGNQYPLLWTCTP